MMNMKLRAWVRYDETGKIVLGGPLLLENKPKVGNWKEIFTTTNPTTTIVPTSTTTTTSTTMIPCGYGILYNWFVVNDERNIAPLGWHVPTGEEWATLVTYLGGASVAGGKMKEVGETHWSSPNTATNSSGFTALPGGNRDRFGAFANINDIGIYWSASESDASRAVSNYLVFINQAVTTSSSYKVGGFSVRLLKNSTSLHDGETGTMTDNDGNVLSTICIGDQEWTSCDLYSTRYRNDELVPNVTNNTAWAALTTGAYCTYNNL